MMIKGSGVAKDPGTVHVVTGEMGGDMKTERGGQEGQSSLSIGTRRARAVGDKWGSLL
jgi:hypothetical protein